MAAHGHLALACATALNTEWTELPLEEPVQLQLTLTALLGITNPVQEGIPKAIQSCHEVRLVRVTPRIGRGSASH